MFARFAFPILIATFALVAQRFVPDASASGGSIKAFFPKCDSKAGSLKCEADTNPPEGGCGSISVFELTEVQSEREYVEGAFTNICVEGCIGERGRPNDNCY